MSRLSIFASACMLAVLAPTLGAHATPSCMRDIKPYKLAGDTMEWSMTISPGADCIQGLRWSTMQIYSISVAEQPKNGEIRLVGPGFRYFAKPDFAAPDTFTLVVVGKNRHEVGTSTLQVTISKPNIEPDTKQQIRTGTGAGEPVKISAISRPE